MEFCSGGSCADLLKPGLIAEEYITIIIRELLMGLDYLHSDKKLHRDIKGRKRHEVSLSGIGLYSLCQLPMSCWARMVRSSSRTLVYLGSSLPP